MATASEGVRARCGGRQRGGVRRAVGRGEQARRVHKQAWQSWRARADARQQLQAAASARVLAGARVLLAKSDFWKAKYDHEAAKKVRAAKKAAKKTTKKHKKKPCASEMLELDDSSESEDDTGLAKQLKKSGQAKPSKKAKVTKPAEDPEIVELSEVLSGYLNQVHSRRDLEIDMVKQMHQKYEDATADLQSQLSDAKTRLKSQESETRKAESKFKFSVAEMEKLKTSFEAERNTWVEEKTALMQRTEKAEATLQEVTTELTGLKYRLCQMVSAIFGPRSSNLNQDMLVKLKDVYTLVEQLYTGAQRAPATISPTNQAPTLLVDILKKLSVLPARMDEMKRSSARAGAVTALSQAKAWLSELDPSEVATGYPSLKEDGTSFDQKDFAACVKEIRPLASLIANELDLSKYHPAYNMENQKMPMSAYKVMGLIPPIRKHNFAPEVDPSGLIDDEAEFQALCGIDWSSPNLQTMEEDEDSEKDDPEASSQQGQEE
nr:uncharacterized protein LOC109747584 [Aegilops tauschii subsp. strangulata]